ncbi:MAG: hypothetical protein Q9227_002458 [Pyrenula ochraceoflavens]
MASAEGIAQVGETSTARTYHLDDHVSHLGGEETHSKPATGDLPTAGEAAEAGLDQGNAGSDGGLGAAAVTSQVPGEVGDRGYESTKDTQGGTGNETGPEKLEIEPNIRKEEALDNPREGKEMSSHAERDIYFDAAEKKTADFKEEEQPREDNSNDRAGESAAGAGVAVAAGGAAYAYRDHNDQVKQELGEKDGGGESSLPSKSETAVSSTAHSGNDDRTTRTNEPEEIAVGAVNSRDKPSGIKETKQESGYATMEEVPSKEETSQQKKHFWQRSPEKEKAAATGAAAGTAVAAEESKTKEPQPTISQDTNTAELSSVEADKQRLDTPKAEPLTTASKDNTPGNGRTSPVRDTSRREVSPGDRTTLQDEGPKDPPPSAVTTNQREEQAPTQHVGFAPEPMVDHNPDQTTERRSSTYQENLHLGPASGDLNDGADFHKRPSTTHNPIIKVRDALFPAGAGPAADSAPVYESDPNFHPTPSKSHNPIIAVRDHMFPAGKGGSADLAEYEKDPNFHKKSSKSHNPIIAVRDALFPAGSSDPQDPHASTNVHPRAQDTEGHTKFPGHETVTSHETHPGSQSSTAATYGSESNPNVIIEPRTHLPMDLSRGTGKGGIDENHNPGYTGGGQPLPSISSIDSERRSSTVIEPRTGLPMDLRKGSGQGGIDGNVSNAGYTGGGKDLPDPVQAVEERRKSTVVEPRTGLPMDTRKGSGAGGIDGAPVPGYQASA